MVHQWDGLHRLTHFGSMDDFWAWAQGDGRDSSATALPFPGAIEAIRRIARQHRVVIVSSKFDWAIPDSLAWLADARVPAREVHFLWDKTLAGCDVYLDDAPHQLEELITALPDATVCRMVHAWNRPLDGALDVNDWAEFRARVDEWAARHSPVPATPLPRS